jgi:hypothetical protein
LREVRLVIAILAACNSAPPVMISNAVSVPPCSAARARSFHALDLVGLDHALAPSECIDGWSIAIDVLCRVPPVSFDNVENVQVTVLGRWVVMYEGAGIVATYRPQMYTGYPGGCIDYSHPGNIAVDDHARLVHAVLGRLADGGVSLVETHQVLQDHPEVDGTSFGEDEEQLELHLHGAEIESKSLGVR